MLSLDTMRYTFKLQYRDARVEALAIEYNYKSLVHALYSDYKAIFANFSILTLVVLARQLYLELSLINSRVDIASIPLSKLYNEAISSA